MAENGLEIPAETPPVDFCKREQELLNQIGNLQKLNEKLIERDVEKTKENENLKKRLLKIQTDHEAELNLPQSQALKAQRDKYESLLTRAKDMLFEKQKTLQSQELQMEAYKVQIETLKDVVALTKDMLNIRNFENENLEAKFETIDVKFKAEKERQRLIEKKNKLQEQLYADLKAEYTAQKNLFKVSIRSR
jgi:hypothetical protein